MTDLSTKHAIRRAALSRRDLVDPNEAHAAARAVASRGLSLVADLAGAAATVGAYWPIRSELSTRPLLEALARADYRTALPVMTAVAKPLVFRRWSPGDDLEVGALGLAEPLPDAPHLVPEILFVPLAAFDARGHRIGYGGGNFDATIAALRSKGPLVAVGLAYEAQEVARIPEEPHDALLDYVVTEERLIKP